MNAFILFLVLTYGAGQDTRVSHLRIDRYESRDKCESAAKIALASFETQGDRQLRLARERWMRENPGRELPTAIFAGGGVVYGDTLTDKAFLCIEVPRP